MGGGGLRTFLLAATAAGMAIAAPAQAAETLAPGVHIDPGSPAAKEYALPLQQARRTGSPASPGRSGEGQLFGAGIAPPGGPRGGGSSSGPGARGGPGAGGTARGVGAPAGGGAASGGGPASSSQTARRAISSGGIDGSTLALIGGGVAIVVLGGFGGTVLRHNRRQHLPPPVDPG